MCIVNEEVMINGTSYTLVFINNGESDVTSAQVAINVGGTSTLSQSWNIEPVSNIYSVDLFGGILPGQTSTSARDIRPACAT